MNDQFNQIESEKNTNKKIENLEMKKEMNGKKESIYRSVYKTVH